MTKQQAKKPRAPAHLRLATRHWWESVCSAYVLEEHHVRLLTLAAEAWDRAADARDAMAKDGTYIPGRYRGSLHVHPAVRVARQAALDFARLLRELDLDTEPPPDPPRPPTPGRRH